LTGGVSRLYFTYWLINRLVRAVSPDRLDATFAALADPTRRAILARLASGESSVKELAEPFEISAPAVTKHLKVLERAGLITRGREAQWRPCRLSATPLREVADWVEPYRRFWDESFDRLDTYLEQLKGHQRQNRKRRRGRTR
jgi:DNA-binding transcriptional ArsR family regulator